MLLQEASKLLWQGGEKIFEPSSIVLMLKYSVDKQPQREQWTKEQQEAWNVRTKLP